MKDKKVLLIILDGWGHGPKTSTNAIYWAETPFMDSLYKSCPNSELTTHSEAVGLPEGQMGNSEVGHLNIGAGRIVYQDLAKINKAIREGSLAKNKTLTDALEKAEEEQKTVHFIGLLSDGGVHSHIDHLKALCLVADKYNTPFFIHAFTDGRDTDPKSGINYIKDFQQFLKPTNGGLVSLIGRYYAMDRDRRWERIKIAYDALLFGEGEHTVNMQEALLKSYQHGITDEFVNPIIKVTPTGDPVGRIKENDTVICFNFRTDRCRQITEVLTQESLPDCGLHTLELDYITMTPYDHSYKNVKAIFDKDDLKLTLGEVLEKNNKKQIRIAETEKYPHVTFFFSGGREERFENEERILIPSPKVATYDLQPEMSAKGITEAILPEIEKQNADFICLNFANADMVGHTGVFDAAVKAVETVDICAQQITEKALENNYTVIIIADHGNADYMRNEDESPNTAHTKNPVPLFILNNQQQYEPKNGKLADIAPTILTIMNIPVPKEMTGEVLI